MEADEVGQGRQNGEGAVVRSLPTPKRVPNEAQRRGLAAAVQRAAELRRMGAIDTRAGRALVDSLGSNEGFLTWSSSPHVMWLASRLQRGDG